MASTYELMFLPALHPASYVLVTSRGASVAMRVYVDGTTRGQVHKGPLPALATLRSQASDLDPLWGTLPFR